MINYEFYQIFEKLLNPVKDAGQDYVRDPTMNLAQVYYGKQSIKLYKIAGDNLRGATSSFLRSDQFGKLPITHSTLTRYFGNDFYKMQPALYYREYNINNIKHSKDLSLQHLLTAEFKDKIQNLFANFYVALSQNYDDNKVIKATFHVEKSLGLGEKTKIWNSLPDQLKTKFADLIAKGHNSLSFTIRKQGGVVSNYAEFREFVLAITFYTVMFNAFVFVGGQDSSSYKLFATQRKIYNNDYITGLYSKDNAKARLNPDGQQVYNEWQDQWNQDDEGRTVWNFEDCWPIYLLDDAKELITYFESVYNVRIRPLEN